MDNSQYISEIIHNPKLNLRKIDVSGNQLGLSFLVLVYLSLLEQNIIKLKQILNALGRVDVHPPVSQRSFVSQTTKRIDIMA